MSKNAVSSEIEAIPTPTSRRSPPPPPSPAPETVSKASPAMVKLDEVRLGVKQVLELLEPSEANGPSTGEMLLEILGQIVESQRQQRILLETVVADLAAMKRGRIASIR
jgi:hypothetical protein